MRAFQRRRRGAPEADPGVSFHPVVLQPEILDDPDELPLAWRVAAEPAQPSFVFNGMRLRVTTDEKGMPWFVAADVCSCLFVGNTSQALGRLDPDEKGLRNVDTPGGAQSMITVNEPGLYTLVLSSRKPEARAFKRWVTHEVLPTIRRTGSYSTTPTPPLPPGVHVVANNPRHANWLWALAVEQHVSSALMAQIAAGGRSRQHHAFQLHLLTPAS
jgi:prophage antirepressor-like protein